MGAYADVMKMLNKDVPMLGGVDWGHLLLIAGAAAAVGWTGLPRTVASTMNKPLAFGFDWGHAALAAGLASTLGWGFYKR